jgi:hypothetical protein
MNFINRYIPAYLSDLKKKGVKILNTKNEFLTMPMHEAALKYGIGYTKEAMGQDMNEMHGLFVFVKDMLAITFKLDSDQMTLAIPYIFDRLQNDPAIRIAMQGMSLMGIKPERISNKDE